MGCRLVLLLAAVAISCGDNRDVCAIADGKLAPPPCSTETCADMFVVAHPDDDLLFMNPDILGSIRAGRRVLTVYVTAGDLSRPGDERYWRDRERGTVSAYAYMITGEGSYEYDEELPPGWTGSPVSVSGVPAYRYADDAHDVSLLFLRLGDYQTQCLWEQANGCSAFNPGPPAPPYLAVTTAGERVSREQLVSVLETEIRELGVTWVGFLDATALHFDTLGSVEKDSYSEYWDHYFTGLFALTAVGRARAAIHVGSYRGYTSSRGAPNLDASESCAKFATFAQYVPYDAAILEQPTPADYVECPQCFLFSGYGRTTPASWNQRRLVSRSRRGRGLLASAAGCVDVAGGVVRVGDCAHADRWETTADNQLRATDSNLCLAVEAPAGYVTRPMPMCGDAPCDPVPPEFPPEVLSAGPCDARAGATMIVLDNGQIRTANARCLTVYGSELVSADCVAERGIDGHVTDAPPPDQRWTFRL